MNEIILKVDGNNNVLGELLSVFDISDDVLYKELIGRKVKVILNDLYYLKDLDYYYINHDNKYMYDNSNIELEIVGIVREKEIVDDNSYFFYNSQLIDYVIDNNRYSKIVLEQRERDYNILGIDVDKDKMLSYN